MWAEPKGAVKFLRVTGEEIEPAFLEIGVREDAFHQPLPKTMAAMRVADDDIAQVTDRGFVRDDSRESHLFLAVVNAKAK